MLVFLVPVAPARGEEVPAITQDPEIERRALQVADGLELELFASEPMIANPVQMNFDARGRLWVLCAPTYPHVVPGQEPADKLVILEDTDDDGRADKHTVFADGLLVPTGFALGDGGVYVANQPELWFLKDTDGDDRADVRRVLLSGFGTEDNHHAISVFRWGPGGVLYFQSGVFLHTQVETPYGLVRLENGGIFEFQPRKMKLRVYAHCYDFLNPWGHAFDRWGQDFLTEAPGGGIFWLAPATADGEAPRPYPQIKGPPKSCGVEFVSSRHLPDDWQGDMILNAFKSKQVLRYKFSDDGSGFAAKEMPPLVVSREDSFRPVDVRVGPDGALYILDWYNALIGHMQYPFRDPRRDHAHGRVWRVTAKGRPLVEKPRLAGASLEELLEHLKAPEAYTRHQARRLLYERDPDEVAAALARWVNASDPDDPEVEHHRLEALWSYQTVDVVEPKLLRMLLRAHDPRARAAATRVLRHWRERLDAPLDLLAVQVNDEHPRVRLEAVAALSHIPEARSMELAAMVVDYPMDRYLDYAFRITANSLKPHWLPALESGHLTFGGNVRRLEAALQAVESPEVAEPLLALWKSGRVSSERQADVLTLLAAVGAPDDLATIFAGRYDARLQATVLAALGRAARDRSVRPGGELMRVRQFFRHADGGVRSEAIRLAGLWSLEELRPDLAGIAEAPDTPLLERRAAVEALAWLGGPSSNEVFRRLCEPEGPYTHQVLGVVGLAAVDVAAAAEHAARVMAGDPDRDPAEVLSAFLEQQGGPEALAAALKQQDLPADVAKLGLRYMYSVGRQDAPLLNVLTRRAGTSATSRELTRRDLDELMAEIQEHGDPERGEAVFRRQDLSCLKCHAINGAGGQVGPDLRGLGASSPVDYLIESVVTPNKAIREGYASATVLTDQGKVYTGIKVQQDDHRLVLRDPERGELTIAVDAVEEMADGGSLMPAGLANLLTRRELVDLVCFISQLGRPGPFATPNVPVVRRWRVLDPVPSALMLMKPAEIAPFLAVRDDLDWTPAYSRVSGTLSLDVLAPDDAQPVSLVRCQIEVTTPGRIALRLNSAEGLMLWIDNESVPARSEIVVDLPRGARTLTFRVNLERRKGAGLRLELAEVPGSSGRAHPVGGF